MTCTELEVLLPDYLDGTLGASQAAEVESHLAGCGSCAALARDSKLALEFMERSAEVQPPAYLALKILEETASGRHGRLGNPAGARGWFQRIAQPLIQPRLVMGMALTIFSFSVMARCGVAPRQLRPGDLDPVMIWASLDDRAHRAWERSVKFYDNLKFVYEIQSRLREWDEQQDEEDRNAAASRPLEERRVPAQGSNEGR